jgi:superfamily II DNA/RNA helicase
MDQMDRERTLIKFRNGSLRLIIATDLAARGLDIPQIKFIIHFELPYNQDEFTHRNGRTARMNKEGIAYVMQSKEERLFVSGGRKDKISKGDLVGFFIKKGLLGADQLGVIEIKHDCAFIGIQASDTEALIQRTTNQYLKKRKVRISLA